MRSDPARPAIWLLILVLFSGRWAFGSGETTGEQPEGDRESVLSSRENIELPRFGQISERPLLDRYANEEEYERARNDARYTFERLTYRSGELEVVAFLYLPVAVEDRQPTIVFNRGSYVRNDAAPEYLTTFHRLAESGFVVLAPMYRGSEGAAGQDEMGGADLQDLMRIAALARELPSVDAESLYLLGESRGGMMVLQAIREGFPALAAAVYGSPTDFFRLFADDPQQYEGIADQIWPDWRTNTDEILRRRSAVRWAEELNVPLLIMHGGSDRSMPVTQSLALAERLQQFGQDYELHVFGYEDHVISGRAAERDALAVAWYERHAGNQDGQ